MKNTHKTLVIVKAIAISAMLLTTQSLRAEKVTLISKAVAPAFDSLEKVLNSQGKKLSAADDLELVGRFNTSDPNFKLLECNNLNINAGKSAKPDSAFFVGATTIKVKGNLNILGGALTKNRGVVQFGDLVLGSGSLLDVYVNEIATWGNSINCAADSRLQFTLFNDKTVTLLGNPAYIGMRLSGSANFTKGAYLVLRFVDASTAPLITPGKYLLVKSSHIEGMPKLIVLSKSAIVANGRFTLEVDGGNLLLVVSP